MGWPISETRCETFGRYICYNIHVSHVASLPHEPFRQAIDTIGSRVASALRRGLVAEANYTGEHGHVIQQ